MAMKQLYQHWPEENKKCALKIHSVQFQWHGFPDGFKKEIVMIIPFIALLAIIIGIVVFMAKAGKRKSEGKDLGDTGRMSTRYQGNMCNHLLLFCMLLKLSRFA